MITIGGKRHNNLIENIQSDFNLHDIWYVKNPTTLSFTRIKTSQFIFCRLDYWLISDSLHDLVTQVDNIASIKTYHSAIVLELKEIEENCKGPGFWKLNTSLLASPEYVKTITSELPTWVQEANDLSNNRIKWDWLKFKIKMCSIAFSKKTSRERQKLEEELNSKYQDALNRFQQNPSNDTKQEVEKLKSELEALYDRKVEGIIVRSRARWHEHGEKNSKYFLNLEKRNHIKKHIRKLYISGKISTDPFQIMDAQKSFYNKLYQRQQKNQNSAGAKRFLDNPSIAKLSEEQTGQVVKVKLLLKNVRKLWALSKPVKLLVMTEFQ